jgi:site-specific recombinase XerD
MNDYFELFIREKTYLQGLAPRSIQHYKESWKAFKKYKGEVSETGVKEFMMNMIASGMKPGAANAFARGVNAYLSWLKENNHTDKHLKIPLQKLEKRVLRTYKTEDVLKIVSFKPRLFSEKRLLALLIVLVDTGMRIDEALSLKRNGVDLDNLLLTIRGKGNKERIIPISREGRKALYRWLKEHEHDYVFCAMNGEKCLYDNTRQDFLALLDKVKVQKSEGCFHTFRRFFAKMYSKAGGNLFYLQRMMGHATLEMTKKYVEVETEDLQLAHKHASPLEHLRN